MSSENRSSDNNWENDWTVPDSDTRDHDGNEPEDESMLDIDNADNWTVAYRAVGEPVFHRATDWSGDWHAAQAKVAEFSKANPTLEVWYVSTRQAELAGYVCLDDIMNILADDGSRIPLADDGTLAAEADSADKDLRFDVRYTSYCAEYSAGQYKTRDEARARLQELARAGFQGGRIRTIHPGEAR